MKKRTRPKRKITAANIRNALEFDALPHREQERRRKAFKALTLMRSQGYTKTAAARAVGISPKSFQDIAGAALRKSPGGKYSVTKGDRLLRVMVIPDRRIGNLEVAIRGSRKASLVAQYDNAVKHYVYTGDASLLQRFEGMTITSNGRRITLLTELDEIDWLAQSHELSFESIYAKAA